MKFIEKKHNRGGIFLVDSQSPRNTRKLKKGEKPAMKLRFASAIAALALLACGPSARAQDRDDNLPVLRSAADAGDLRGLFALGNRFFPGQGAERDSQQPLAYFRAAAHQAIAPPHTHLGLLPER